MRDNVRWIIISVLIVGLLITSVSFMSNGVAPTSFISLNSILGKVTGQITGVYCVPSMKISAPEAVTISPGAHTDIQIDVSDINCGVSRATLTLTDFPEDYYTVTPEYHPTLSPKNDNSYTITFSAPKAAEGMVYLTNARIRGSGSNFYSSDIEVTVDTLPTKPGAVAGTPAIENIVTTKSRGVLDSFLSSQTWWAVSLIVVIAAISLVIYEYLPEEARKTR